MSTTDHQSKVHKAAPLTTAHEEDGVGYCKVCGQRVKRVPGGRGPIWVHTDTGAVAALNPPEPQERTP